MAEVRPAGRPGSRLPEVGVVEEIIDEVRVDRSRGGELAVLVEGRAFEAREIASQIGVDEGAVSTALSRLKDHERVEHEATYWAVTGNDERLERSGDDDRMTAPFNEQLGEEDPGPGPNTLPTSHSRSWRTSSNRRKGRPNIRAGDVVYGDDPFKGEEAARPWRILANHQSRPLHGE